jgi:ABC-type lipoprotein export system ATPase subunit
MQIQHFRVSGLQARRPISVEFRDNCLILVGENGSGKTTLINMMYYFLSGQWERLSEYQFDEVQAVVDDEVIAVRREHIAPTGIEVTLRRLPPQYRIRMRRLLASRELVTPPL